MKELFGRLLGLVSRRRPQPDESVSALPVDVYDGLMRIVEQGTLYAVVLDSRGRVVYCNDYLFETTGRTRAETVGRDWFDLFVPVDQRPTVAGEFGAKLPSGTIAAHYENDIVTATGERRTVSWSNAILRDERGAPVGTASIGQDITEQRRAEAATRASNRRLERIAAERGAEVAEALGVVVESEARYQELVDNANDLIYSHDLSMYVTSMNLAVERITGYTREEALKMSMRDLLTPESLARASEMTRRAQIERGQTSYEVDLIAKDGRLVPLEVSTRFILRDGIPVGVQGTARDITSRRQAEAALAERVSVAALAADVGRALTTQASLREALDACAEALVRYQFPSLASIWTVAESGQWLELGGAAGEGASSLDTSARVSIGEHLIGRVAEERRPVIVPFDDAGETLAGERTRGVGAGMRSIAAFPLMVDERVVGVMALLTSASLTNLVVEAIASAGNEIALGIDRANTIEMLAHSEARYRSLFDGAPVGIYRSSPDGRILAANAAFVAMLGYDDFEQIEALDLDHDWFVAGYDRATFRTLIERDGEVAKLEATWRRRDGSEFVASENARTIRSDDGQTLYYEGTVEDVTERVRAIEAMQRAHEAALESARVKSRFLANMSHEIRTPLNGILGMTQLMLTSGLTPKQLEFTDTIRQCGETLLAIVDDVLDLAKIESGKFVLDRIAFDARDVVDDVARIVNERARAKGVEILVDVNADVPTRGYGDPVRVRQALLNLVGNAAKFTNRGRISIGVSLVETGEESFVVRFEVSDTGIGIEPELLPRLFVPFVQADTSSTRRFGGTGLGLAITKDLVERMGGEVDVSSVPGHGSTFGFTVRLGSCEPVESAAPSGAPSVHAIRQAPQLGASVLLVDDDAVNISVATAMLDSLGCSSHVARNGREALDAMSARAFDIVLMDCQMPVMDGFAATAEIRNLETGERHIPIVAFTASVLDGEVRRCFEAGMDDVLHKPLLFDALQAALVRWTAPEKVVGE